MPARYKKALQTYERLAREFGNISSDRERVMVEAIGPEIIRAATDGRLSKDAQSLSVSFFVGASHTHVYRTLFERGEQIRALLQENPLAFDHHAEFVRRIARGDVTTPDDVRKAYSEVLLGWCLQGVGRERYGSSNTERTLNTRDIVDCFTKKEHELFHEAMRRSPFDAYALVQQVVSRRGTPRDITVRKN